MTQRTYQDPVLELATRTDFGSVYDLATTDEEAQIVLAVLNEVDAEEHARNIGAQMAKMGYLR